MWTRWCNSKDVSSLQACARVACGGSYGKEEQVGLVGIQGAGRGLFRVPKHAIFAGAQDAIDDKAQRRKEEQAEYDRIQEVYRGSMQDVQPDLVGPGSWSKSRGHVPCALVLLSQNKSCMTSTGCVQAATAQRLP